MDEPQPQEIPTAILKQNGALSLYWLAVVGLVVVAVLTIGGGMILAFAGRAVPGELIALGGVAIGALSGMVAPGKAGE